MDSSDIFGEMQIFEPKNKFAVWIHDSDARLFLGLPPAKVSPSRWAILGEFVEEASTGIWIDVDHVQEWTHDGDTWRVTNTWNVTPPRCLVLWTFVITIQLVERFDGLKALGFRKE